MPFSYRSPDGLRLGQWINVQRNAYAAGTLTDDRRERLEQLTGWTWNSRLQLWEDGYAALCRYVKATGSATVSYDCVFDGFESRELGDHATARLRAGQAVQDEAGGGCAGSQDGCGMSKTSSGRLALRTFSSGWRAPVAARGFRGST